MTIEVIIFSVAVIILISYFFWFVFDYHDKNLKEPDPIVIQLDNGGNFVSREIKPDMIKPTVDTFDLFEQFLMEKGIFELYFSYIDINAIDNFYTEDFIMYGFNWSNTKETEEYWCNIDTLWKNYLLENK